MRLSELETGKSAVIVKVFGHGAFRRRIMEMGFIHGKRVTSILNAPLKDPVKYKIMDYEVSLRRSEASMIEIIPEDAAGVSPRRKGGKVVEHSVEHLAHKSKHKINVALVGNPNSGKTSLFNIASGSRQHVGNYSGVTVDAKKGSFTHKGYRFEIIDLPGTYALSAYSPEEVYVRRHLVEHTPDVVVNVVAAPNIERNLYLTTELIDMDCTTVMAFNMYDEFESSGAELDYVSLGNLLGIPIVPTVSRTGKGIPDLFDKIIEVYEHRDPQVRHIHITHTPEIEEGIEALERAVKSEGSVLEQFSTRYIAIKMLEDDKEIRKLMSAYPNFHAWEKERDKHAENIEKILGEDIETAVANDKYGFISGALKETYTPGFTENINKTKAIDSFVTHKLFGFPVFILLIWLMFEATFTLGEYPMQWIEAAVAGLGGFVERTMSDGMLKDLIIDGIIGGVGGVIVFLPNILILYLFISFMEDSGYMARAAFIMDKIMHRIGLHGKSFIPLIIGFGCNVPAIMATRTIESRSSRLITILINPFMSCSARLPVYVLLVGAFFPEHGSFVMLALYLTGILVAGVTAKLLRKFLFKDEETPFVMELPPYRMPTARSTVSHMWDKAAQYLKKMGGVILIASIVVWFLSYFPRAEISGSPSRITGNTYTVDNAGQHPASYHDHDAEVQKEYLQHKNSYIGRLGQFMTPVMEPLGFDWQLSVSLISGTAAKEIIVSTLGVLYPDHDDHFPLSERLQRTNPETGKPNLTPLKAMSFLVFVLLYFPCIAALIAIARESGSWKWALFSFFYNTFIAWIAAFLVYNIGSLFV